MNGLRPEVSARLADASVEAGPCIMGPTGQAAANVGPPEAWLFLWKNVIRKVLFFYISIILYWLLTSDWRKLSIIETLTYLGKKKPSLTKRIYSLRSSFQRFLCLRNQSNNVTKSMNPKFMNSIVLNLYLEFEYWFFLQLYYFVTIIHLNLKSTL